MALTHHQNHHFSKGRQEQMTPCKGVPSLVDRFDVYHVLEVRWMESHIVGYIQVL